jgi:glycosyltransferase involved in cell wall biosynthesis
MAQPKIVTITVGIPAFNEAANIRTLLQNILAQKLKNGILKQILVVSDGSTDSTVAEAKSLGDKRIRVVEGEKQMGQARRQNQIFEMSTTDIVVLLNADVLPTKNTFIQEIIKPFMATSNVGLVAAKVMPVSTEGTYISRVLDWHMRWKTQLFEKINGGDTLYLCHGRARAFARGVYQQMRWPKLTGEDAYSYIFTKSNGFKFVYTPAAQVWYASPRSISDHVMQSVRFFSSEKELIAHPKIGDAKWYTIPESLLLPAIIKGFFTQPLYFTTYLVIMALAMFRLSRTKQKSSNLIWEASASTKAVAVPGGKVI